MSGPKWSRGTLDLVNNTFVVRNGLIYDYYPISVLPKREESHFYEIDISPGVQAPGTAIIGKTMYDVSIRDLLRRHIDVRKKQSTDSTTKQTRTGRQATVQTDIRAVQSDPDEFRPSDFAGNEIGKDADMAWEDQVGTLLQTLHSEEGEEFEITSSPQSGSTDEDSPIQNSHENP